MKKKAGIFSVLLCVFAVLHGQETVPQKKNPFSFEATYVGDFYGNATGGLKQGGGYMGMGNLKIGFDTEKARWWKGGSLFINAASIHGKSLSENFLGDLQAASNIDAGMHVYLHELWFRQEFDKISFTVGLQDLNADFMASENGGEFLNSSFGVPSVMAVNVPIPIFPLTGLGISAQWNINDMFTWQSAVFDGYQSPFEHNPHNLHWKFNKNDGILAVTEFHSTFNPKGKEGTYKLGAYYHSGLSEFDEMTRTANAVFKDNFGFYLLADQIVYEQGNRKIGLFTQVAVAPKSKNEQDYYVGLGMNCFGVFCKQMKDALGFAVAHAGLHNTSHKHETALELYYKWQFNDNFALQPDIQYIINPSGTENKLPNALAGILRFYVNF